MKRKVNDKCEHGIPDGINCDICSKKAIKYYCQVCNAVNLPFGSGKCVCSEDAAGNLYIDLVEMPEQKIIDVDVNIDDEFYKF